MTFPEVSNRGMRDYQLDAVRSIVHGGRPMLVLRYGRGKTWVALRAAWETATAAREHTFFVNAVFFCKGTAAESLADEIRNRVPEACVHIVTSSSGPTDAPLPDHRTYLLVPHHLAARYEYDLVDYCRKQRPCALICDESTKIKNNRSARSEACRAVAAQYHHHVTSGLLMAMTGRMMPEGPHEAWAQLDFCCKRPLGATFYTMLRQYFLTSDRGPVLRLDRRQMFFEQVSKYVTRLSPQQEAEEAKRGPVVVNRLLTYTATKQQRELTKSLLELLEVEREDGTFDEYKYAICGFAKAQQIANGFYRAPDGEVCLLDENPKLDLLIDTVEELLEEDHQVVVWCHYHSDYDLITARLTAAKVSHVVGSAYSEVMTFYRGEARVILMPLTASEGINELAVADVAIYYTNVFSSETRDQADARLDRPLIQKSPLIVLIDLCSDDLRDRAVIDSLRFKRPLKPTQKGTP